MKTTVFTMLLTAFIGLQGLAKVVTVSNNTSVPAQYHIGSGTEFLTMTDFLNSDAVAEADQVVVMPTKSNYGSMSINKSITLISNGHLEKETVGHANFHQVFINTSNIKLVGLTIRLLSSTSSSNQTFENFYLKNCRIGEMAYIDQYVNNYYFEGNLFAGGVTIRTQYSANTKHNVVFQNNVFAGNSSLYILKSEGLTADVRFVNNTFVGASRQNTSKVEGAAFINNVFKGWAFSATQTTGNTFYHNVFAQANGIPDGNTGNSTNNELGYAVTFVQDNGNGTYDYDNEDFRLAQQPYAGQQAGITESFVGTGSVMGKLQLTIASPVTEQNQPVNMQIINNQ